MKMTLKQAALEVLQEEGFVIGIMFAFLDSLLKTTPLCLGIGAVLLWWAHSKKPRPESNEGDEN